MTVWALVAIGVAPIPHVIVQGIEGSDGFFFGIIVMAVALVVAGIVWRFGGWTLLLGTLVGVFGWLSFSVDISYDSDGVKTFFDFAPAVVSGTGRVRGRAAGFLPGPPARSQGHCHGS